MREHQYKESERTGERERDKCRQGVREKEKATGRNGATYRAPTWRQTRWPWAPQQVLAEQVPNRTAQEQRKTVQASSARVRRAVSDHILRHLSQRCVNKCMG